MGISKYSLLGKLNFLIVLILVGLNYSLSAHCISGRAAMYIEGKSFIFEIPADNDKNNLATEQNNTYVDIFITQDAFLYLPDHSIMNAVYNKEKALNPLPSKKVSDLSAQGQATKKITYPQHPKKPDFFLPCSRTFYTLSCDRGSSAVISNHYQDRLFSLWEQSVFRVLHFSKTSVRLYTNPDQVSGKITNGRGIRPPPFILCM